MTKIEEMLNKESPYYVTGLGNATVGKLKTIGIYDIEQLRNTDWKTVCRAKGIGVNKVVQIYNSFGMNITEDIVMDYIRSLNKVKVDQSELDKSTNKPIQMKIVTNEQKEEQMKELTKIVQPDISAMAEQTPTNEAKFENGFQTGKVHKKISLFVKTNDFKEFCRKFKTDEDFKKVKEQILKVASENCDTGARYQIKTWLNALQKFGNITYDSQLFNNYDYIQPFLSKLIDIGIENIKNERKNGINEGDAAFVLYKVYSSAVGSGWDGNVKDDQLGMINKDEFIRRIKIKSPTTPDDIIERVWSGIITGTSSLFSGSPGSGKTYFAIAVGNSVTDNLWSQLKFSRLNIYEGITTDDIIGSWDYQAQILKMSASKIKLESLKNISDEDIENLRENIYTEDNFTYGALTLSMINGIPMLIDEINRATPDVQNMLLQAIDEKEIVIPHIGKIKGSPNFYVIFTINEDDVGTNPLSEAFLRRVKYIVFEDPKDMTQFIPTEYPEFSKKLLNDIEVVREKIQGVIEGRISPDAVSKWSQELVAIYGADIVLDKEKVRATLGSLIKNKEDMEAVKEVLESQIINHLPEHANSKSFDDQIDEQILKLNNPDIATYFLREITKQNSEIYVNNYKKLNQLIKDSLAVLNEDEQILLIGTHGKSTEKGILINDHNILKIIIDLICKEHKYNSNRYLEQLIVINEFYKIFQKNEPIKQTTQSTTSQSNSSNSQFNNTPSSTNQVSKSLKSFLLEDMDIIGNKIHHDLTQDHINKLDSMQNDELARILKKVDGLSFSKFNDELLTKYNPNEIINEITLDKKYQTSYYSDYLNNIFYKKSEMTKYLISSIIYFMPMTQLKNELKNINSPQTTSTTTTTTNQSSGVMSNQELMSEFDKITIDYDSDKIDEMFDENSQLYDSLYKLDLDEIIRKYLTLKGMDASFSSVRQAYMKFMTYKGLKTIDEGKYEVLAQLFTSIPLSERNGMKISGSYSLRIRNA